MSKLLFAESPLVVQPNVAKAIGLNEAIVLQQLEYWMRRAGGKTINGEHWIYNSVKEWKKQFPFWSEATISRTLENLEDAQLIKTGCYNKMTTDRTKWYTVNYVTVDLLDLLMTLEAEREAEEAAAEGVTNAFQQNEESMTPDCPNLPETSPEKTHTQKPSEVPSPKRQALDVLEKEFFKFGGTMNPRLIESFFLVVDKNPDHPTERLANAVKRLQETRNPYKAIDGYREWRDGPPPNMPPRFQKQPAATYLKERRD